jgi:hypothetical protein
MQLIQIISVQATATPDHYEVDIEADIGNGPETLPFSLDPNDPYGLAPQVKAAIDAWIAAENPVEPYDLTIIVNEKITQAPSDLFGGPTLGEIFNVNN